MLGTKYVVCLEGGRDGNPFWRRHMFRTAKYFVTVGYLVYREACCKAEQENLSQRPQWSHLTIIFFIQTMTVARLLVFPQQELILNL